MTATTDIAGRPYRSCSRAQEAIWFAEQTSAIGAANNLPLTVDMSGRLDRRSLDQALTDVVRSQPALRMQFKQRDGRLLWRECGPDEVEPVELAVEPTPAPEREIRRRAQIPLDLLAEPYALGLLRFGSDRHVLFANFHHAIFDGASKDIFVDDLAAAYRARVCGNPMRLGTRKSFGDHIDSEQARAGELEAEAARYWGPMLAVAGQALQFPDSVHRADPSRARGNALSFVIAGDLKAGIDGLARKRGVSRFVTLLGAIQLLQHIYAGRGDGGVATLIPLGTRTPETHDTIGMFVNEVPFYGVPADALRLPEYLDDVAARVRELSRLRHYPFNEASVRFGPGGDPHALLPRFGLSYRKAAPRNPVLPDLEVRVDRLVPVYGRRLGARFRFLDLPGELLGRCEYDSAVLHESAAARLATHLQTLLAAMVADPTARLSELSLLPGPERRRLVVEWNATEDHHPPATVQQLLEAQIERRCDRAAAVFGEQQLTYRELNRRANMLAHELIALGAGPDTRVAIYLERGLPLVVAVLAVAKAGAGHLPLDPAYPRERLAFMVDDCGAAIIITQETLRSQLPGRVQHVVCVDSSRPGRVADPDRNPPLRATPESLAYVIYTSGSTGRPKGAELVQSAVVNLIRSMCDQPGLTADDVFLSVTTLSFDIGTVELLAPLAVGARVVIAPTEAAVDGRALVGLLQRSGATMMFGTPSRWRLAVSAGWNGDQKVIVGGEALSIDVAQDLMRRSRAVWNIYGPTETTVFSTRKRMKDPARITIGRPVANTRLYVLDRTGGLSPTGIPGELCIAGAGLARGYVNRPELTAERFVLDPFGSTGSRLYKTGDLVRQRDDGEIEFLGRVDDQVKIRGFRVEPGEIQAALLDQPCIRRAAVITREDTVGGKRLVAYLVSAGDPPPLSDIRARLLERLPEFMVPSAFVFLADLPLNANGKVDRTQLPQPDADSHDKQIFVGPRSETESHLVSIWAGVLDVGRVGVHDNFFELGGHSLLAAELVGRVREELAADLSLRDIFAAPTVAGMAATLASHDATTGPTAFPRATRKPLVGG